MTDTIYTDGEEWDDFDSVNDYKKIDSKLCSNSHWFTRTKLIAIWSFIIIQLSLIGLGFINNNALLNLFIFGIIGVASEIFGISMLLNGIGAFKFFSLIGTKDKIVYIISIVIGVGFIFTAFIFLNNVFLLLPFRI